MYKAKVPFLWYKQGDEIEESEQTDNLAKWISQGLVEDVKKPEPKPKSEPVVESKPKKKTTKKKRSKKK